MNPKKTPYEWSPAIIGELEAILADDKAPARVKLAARKLMIAIGVAAGLDLRIIAGPYWKQLYAREA